MRCYRSYWGQWCSRWRRRKCENGIQKEYVEVRRLRGWLAGLHEAIKVWVCVGLVRHEGNELFSSLVLPYRKVRDCVFLTQEQNQFELPSFDDGYL